MLILNISDPHAGSAVAMLPREPRLSKALEVSPNSIQSIIADQYTAALKRVVSVRKWREPLTAIINGDCIEGNHHGTTQIVTPSTKAQMDIFRDIWDETTALVKPDKVYMVAGTETHVGEWETIIGEYVKAEPNGAYRYVFPVLKRRVEGKVIWWAHHGPGPGRGNNQGNALRNALKSLLVQCLANNETSPDIVVYGHTHSPTYETATLGRHTVHGFILPSLKAKDAYIYKVQPFALNSVGVLLFDINKQFPAGRLENGWWEWQTLEVVQDKIGEL